MVKKGNEGAFLEKEEPRHEILSTKEVALLQKARHETKNRNEGAFLENEVADESSGSFSEKVVDTRSITEDALQNARYETITTEEALQRARHEILDYRASEVSLHLELLQAQKLAAPFEEMRAEIHDYREGEMNLRLELSQLQRELTVAKEENMLQEATLNKMNVSYSEEHVGSLREAQQLARLASSELDEVKTNYEKKFMLQQREHEKKLEDLKDKAMKRARKKHLVELKDARACLAAAIQRSAENNKTDVEADMNADLEAEVALETSQGIKIVEAMQKKHKSNREKVVNSRDALRALALIDLTAKEYRDECALAIHKLSDAFARHSLERNHMLEEIEAENRLRMKDAIRKQAKELAQTFKKIQ
eukprot:g2761.t1